MYPESEFDEVVLFDVPTLYADELWLRLQMTRLTWRHRTEEGDLFVVAALRVERGDLARLLRDVQEWIAGSDVPYVTFLLDGREYALRTSADVLAA
jgi:hypothetical protein